MLGVFLELISAETTIKAAKKVRYVSFSRDISFGFWSASLKSGSILECTPDILYIQEQKYLF